MSKETGGPAFPIEFTGQPGMTLRDYFAAKAMQGRFSVQIPCELDERAKLAYEMADAMLKEREK